MVDEYHTVMVPDPIKGAVDFWTLSGASEQKPTSKLGVRQLLLQHWLHAISELHVYLCKCQPSKALLLLQNIFGNLQLRIPKIYLTSFRLHFFQI